MPIPGSLFVFNPLDFIFDPIKRAFSKLGEKISASVNYNTNRQKLLRLAKNNRLTQFDALKHRDLTYADQMQIIDALARCKDSNLRQLSVFLDDAKSPHKDYDARLTALFGPLQKFTKLEALTIRVSGTPLNPLNWDALNHCLAKLPLKRLTIDSMPLPVKFFDAMSRVQYPNTLQDLSLNMQLDCETVAESENLINAIPLSALRSVILDFYPPLNLITHAFIKKLQQCPDLSSFSSNAELQTDPTGKILLELDRLVEQTLVTSIPKLVQQSDNDLYPNQQAVIDRIKKNLEYNSKIAKAAVEVASYRTLLLEEKKRFNQNRSSCVTEARPTPVIYEDVDLTPKPEAAQNVAENDAQEFDVSPALMC